MATAYAFGGAAEALPLYQPVPDFSGLIGNLGRESFGDDLLDLFESMTGADHCSVYHEKAYQFSEVMARSGQARSIYCDDHFSTYHVRQSFRKFAARHATVEILPLGNPKADTTPVITQPQAILITGQTDDGLFAVKLLRVATYSQNPDTTIDLLQSIADILISLIARHQSLSKSKSTGFSA